MADIMNICKLYWRFFNFLIRRIMAVGFILGGIVLFIYGIPSILPGGTVQLNGQPTDDMVFRFFSALFPLIVVVLGIFLFRIKPYYPSSIIRTAQEAQNKSRTKQ
jgi:hypothetical protein